MRHWASGSEDGGARDSRVLCLPSDRAAIGTGKYNGGELRKRCK